MCQPKALEGDNLGFACEKAHPEVGRPQASTILHFKPLWHAAIRTYKDTLAIVPKTEQA